MASIKDFDKLFATRPQVATNPHVTLDGFKFRLLSIEPDHNWVKTGELKPNGEPKWAQETDYITDETGERVRCKVGLQLVDAHGMATSAAAPFIDNKHYFGADQLQIIIPQVGQYVELVNPRIELREVAAEDKKGFKRVETRMLFIYDDIKV